MSFKGPHNFMLVALGHSAFSGPLRHWKEQVQYFCRNYQVPQKGNLICVYNCSCIYKDKIKDQCLCNSLTYKVGGPLLRTHLLRSHKQGPHMRQLIRLNPRRRNHCQTNPRQSDRSNSSSCNNPAALCLHPQRWLAMTDFQFLRLLAHPTFEMMNLPLRNPRSRFSQTTKHQFMAITLTMGMPGQTWQKQNTLAVHQTGSVKFLPFVIAQEKTNFCKIGLIGSNIQTEVVHRTWRLDASNAFGFAHCSYFYWVLYIGNWLLYGCQ